MLGSAIAFWFSAAVTCHISVSAPEERLSSALHPIWLQGAISLAFLPRMLASPRIYWLVRGYSNLFTCLVLLSGLRVQMTRGTKSGEQSDGAMREERSTPSGLCMALAIKGGAR